MIPDAKMLGTTVWKAYPEIAIFFIHHIWYLLGPFNLKT